MPDRYQKEIEEILRQAGEIRPTRARRREEPGIWRLAWLYARQSLNGKGWSLSAGRVMLIALSLLLAALIVSATVPGLVAPLAWAGLLLFIVGYGMFFVKPPQISRMEKRWRGQPIDDGEQSWWGRFRRKTK